MGRRNEDLTRGITAGLAGGLAGTIVMQLFGASIFALLRWPTNTSFAIIGDAAAAFFSGLGIALTGGAPLGARLYYLIGLVLGAILGIAVVIWKPLRMDSLRKGLVLSILYVEAMSIPLLVAGTLSLKMSMNDAILWFGISVIMHLVYGLVLGVILSYVLRGRLQTSPA